VPDPKRSLILASNSPRRRELLRQAGYRFEVRPPPIDDHGMAQPASPEALVESLAYMKATATIAADSLGQGLVLGADTIVALGDEVIGKPASEAEARRILARLAGAEQRVMTGLALVDAATGRRWLDHDVTRLRMRRMTPQEIDAYVASGEAMGKAGAYAIQETGDRYIEQMVGSLTNVVGLPMELLERLLKTAGYDPKEFQG
jgi:septum formation protein